MNLIEAISESDRAGNFPKTIPNAPACLVDRAIKRNWLDWRTLLHYNTTATTGVWWLSWWAHGKWWQLWVSRVCNRCLSIITQTATTIMWINFCPREKSQENTAEEQYTTGASCNNSNNPLSVSQNPRISGHHLQFNPWRWSFARCRITLQEETLSCNFFGARQDSVTRESAAAAAHTNGILTLRILEVTQTNTTRFEIWRYTQTDW